ncbi:hypothetical protein OOJ09_25895 [Mesorhizobium qingshengii]|uniref:Uncharacterized protein n=1 Tax=Mesorhizobium qingshengii TaxID=1165689 RepID=A0ABT4R244_9HYPH|nr:hypothetical protein [Mesorhizobium qingshengii]MCZ8547633.1 hypothetical protein [Mesorhizobium qingshengii]
MKPYSEMSLAELDAELAAIRAVQAWRREQRMASIRLPDGRELPRIRHSKPHACSDCGVADGDLHAAWCQHEPCPSCGGQLISCLCFDGEERAA